MTVQHARPPVEPGLLSRALDVAGRLANDAAEVITATAGRERGTSGEHPYDWVTDTDRTLERHTRRVLAADFPGVPVVGPAAAEGGDAAPRWVVTPVDGAANYVAGIGWCAYSLALVDAHGPVVGVVADPGRAHIYAAARGRGGRANGRPLRAPARAVAGGLVCAEVSPPRLGDLAARAAAAHAGLRVLGSAALAIVQVALGRAVAAVLEGPLERETAGAVCLATEAGARVAALPGGGLAVGVAGALEDVADWWVTPAGSGGPAATARSR
jgi:myo-inositol-1(or 4)-monophosphatase